jgi:YggT family protein
LDLICTLLGIYSWIIFARIILSWVRVEPGTGLASVASVVYNLTEPVLGPIRSVIPPMRMGMAALDLSPLIVFFVILVIC